MTLILGVDILRGMEKRSISFPAITSMYIKRYEVHVILRPTTQKPDFPAQLIVFASDFFTRDSHGSRLRAIWGTFPPIFLVTDLPKCRPGFLETAINSPPLKNKTIISDQKTVLFYSEEGLHTISDRKSQGWDNARQVPPRDYRCTSSYYCRFHRLNTSADCLDVEDICPPQRPDYASQTSSLSSWEALKPLHCCKTYPHQIQVVYPRKRGWVHFERG